MKVNFTGVSTQVKDLMPLEDFEDLLNTAVDKAETPWAQHFVEDLSEGYAQKHGEMFLSQKQLDKLRELACD